MPPPLLALSPVLPEALRTVLTAPSYGPTDAPAACTDQSSYTCAFVYDWTGSSTVANGATWLLGKPMAILLLVVVGIVVRWLLHRVIGRVVAGTAAGIRPRAFGRGALGRGSSGVEADPAVGSTRHKQRVETLGSLLKSISTGVVVAVVVVMAISQLGYDIGPIVAGAGILGVAIGFGAQTLVKDFLSGIFMMFEDQYGVGDEVDLGNATGVVEAVSLRVTRLRDVNGTVWYVRNGEIAQVGNMSQNWARTVLDIPVGYDEDLARVRRVLGEVATSLWDDPAWRGEVIDEPSVWGVQSLDPDSVLVRVVMKTPPGKQWSVAREMRERVKARFDEERIEIPLPQRVVWHREAGDGSVGDAGSTGPAADGARPGAQRSPHDRDDERVGALRD